MVGDDVAVAGILPELMAEAGSIWVSIDGNEAHYLKVVMDEVFGRSHVLTSFIWKKNSFSLSRTRAIPWPLFFLVSPDPCARSLYTGLQRL